MRPRSEVFEELGVSRLTTIIIARTTDQVLIRVLHRTKSALVRYKYNTAVDSLWPSDDEGQRSCSSGLLRAAINRRCCEISSAKFAAYPWMDILGLVCSEKNSAVWSTVAE